MVALASSLQTANAVFADLGFTLYEASIAGGVAAREFADIFGGVQNMLQATSSYYQRFYSDSERVARSTEVMTKALADMGLVLPATIEGFRNLVEQAERMGNMDQVGQLIALSGNFAGMIDAQESVRQQAEQDLTAAFQREMAATRAMFAEKIDGLRDSLTGARERLASSKAIADALTSALKSRIFPSVDAQRQSQDRAADYLASLVGMARIDDVDALQAALSVVANPSMDTYATLEEYRRDFDRTSNVIADLEETAGFALNKDQETINLIEQQIADAQMQSDQAVDLLQQQLDGLLGIDQSIQSLADAIMEFLNPTVPAAGGGGGGGGASGLANLTNPGGPLNNDGILDTTTAYGATNLAEQVADGNNSRKIAQMYQSILGRPADAAGMQYYVDLARTNSLSSISAALAASQEATTGVVPSYSGGGYTGSGARSGGLDGMGGFMAMLHPRETVVDHTRPAPPRGNTMSDADQRELLRLLRMIERNTKDTTRGVEDLNEAAA
jgi:hypothetical protein